MLIPQQRRRHLPLLPKFVPHNDPAGDRSVSDHSHQLALVKRQFFVIVSLSRMRSNSKIEMFKL
jgi:hypothetical protein